MKTRQLATDAMLAAMCAVLGYLSVDLGNLKITFESLPVLVAAFILGPADGLLVGCIGTLIYQILRYGLTVTTVLWMLPYMLCGLLVGLYAKRKHFSLSKKEIALAVTAAELMILVLNTAVMAADSFIYGYYSKAYIFGSFWIRLLICIAKSVAFSLILPGILQPVRKFIYRGDQQ